MKLIQLFRELKEDECGIILSAEVVLVTTILVIGSIAGLTTLNYAVNSELNDMANAVEKYDVSYEGQGDYGGDVYSLSDEPAAFEVAGDGN